MIVHIAFISILTSMSTAGVTAGTDTLYGHGSGYAAG